MDLKSYIREIPDYPKAGINFKDITTLIGNGEALNYVINSITERFRNKGITKVVGLEARGFIVGGAIAARLNAGFVPIRKPGKLPAEVVSESYELEYGEDRIEMHTDAIDKDDVVLIHDDLLATGGSAMAALKLVRRKEVKKIHLSFICDLTFIDNPKKREILQYDHQVLVKY